MPDFDDMTLGHRVIRAQEVEDRAALIHEFGPYELKDLVSTDRVALIPRRPNEDPHVLYLVEQRLIVDDYLTPEEVAELDGQEAHNQGSGD